MRKTPARISKQYVVRHTITENMSSSMSYATHTPADLGALTNRLVGVKAVGRLQSVGVCATLRRRSALLHRLTPIQMLNLPSALIRSRR